MLAHLKDITGPLLDPLQFAYRANRSVDGAVNVGLHYVLQHVDRPGAYVRILFVDFSSAFNTIIPNLLLTKLTQPSVPSSICQWINSFLTDRQQLVRLGKYTSSTHVIITGAPQGCVLSPLLFSLYTNDCTSNDRGLQEKPPCSPPTHHHGQHCDCSGVIQVPGHHHVPGPEVGQSHRLHCEKDPADVVLPSPAEEVQPATGAPEKVILCHH